MASHHFFSVFFFGRPLVFSDILMFIWFQYQIHTGSIFKNCIRLKTMLNRSAVLHVVMQAYFVNYYYNLMYLSNTNKSL